MDKSTEHNSPWPDSDPDNEWPLKYNYQLATHGQRVGGALVDTLVQVLVGLPILYVTGQLSASTLQAPTISESIISIVIGLGVVILLQGYLLANYGQTIGKRVVGTKIVSIDTNDILPLSRVILLRVLPVQLLALFPFLILLAAGLLDIALVFGEERRVIHDRIASTRVIQA